jgi:hypothetical protein
MISSKIRTGTTRFLKDTLRNNRARVLPTATQTTRFVSTEQEKEFQERGILDEEGLTVFDTLRK